MHRVAYLGLLFCVTIVGCYEPQGVEVDFPFGTNALPEVSGSELQSFVARSEKPVLVEFGVDFNCERCQSVNSEVQDLAEKYKDTVKVVRVDFTANVKLVARYGGTICPTYVIFDHGKPVSVQSFPTSAARLESELVNLVQQPGTK